MKFFIDGGASKFFGFRVVGMGWIIAIIVIGLAVGGLVGGTVLHPFLYGLFIAAVAIVPMWIISSIIKGVIDSIFGRRD